MTTWVSHCHDLLLLPLVPETVLSPILVIVLLIAAILSVEEPDSETPATAAAAERNLFSDDSAAAAAKCGGTPLWPPAGPAAAKWLIIAEGGHGYNGENAGGDGWTLKLPGLYQWGPPGFEYGDAKYSSLAALLAANAAADGDMGPRPALGAPGIPLFVAIDCGNGSNDKEELLVLVAVSTIDQIRGLMHCHY